MGRTPAKTSLARLAGPPARGARAWRRTGDFSRGSSGWNALPNPACHLAEGGRLPAAPGCFPPMGAPGANPSNSSKVVCALEPTTVHDSRCATSRPLWVLALPGKQAGLDPAARRLNRECLQ